MVRELGRRKLQGERVDAPLFRNNRQIAGLETCFLPNELVSRLERPPPRDVFREDSFDSTRPLKLLAFVSKMSRLFG